jgi:hypothetical protein
MKRKAMEWKTKAEEAASPGDSSCKNFENLLADILSVQKTRNKIEKGKLVVLPVFLYQQKNQSNGFSLPFNKKSM